MLSRPLAATGSDIVEREDSLSFCYTEGATSEFVCYLFLSVLDQRQPPKTHSPIKALRILEAFLHSPIVERGKEDPVNDPVGYPGSAAKSASVHEL